MLRIGLCSDTFLPIIDGVGRVVFQYAQNLSSRGHRVYVLCPRCDAGCRDDYPFEIIDYASVPLPGAPQYAAGVPGIDFHYQKRINAVTLDLIHAHSPGPSGALALRLARKRKIPLVGTFHSKYYEDFYRITHSKLLAQIGTNYVVDFYDKCTEVWTVSRDARDTLCQYGYRGEAVLMPNGAELRTRPRDPAAILAPLGLPNAPMLLYVGQIDNKKNLPRVLRACALAAAHASFVLVLAGRGRDQSDLRTLAEQLGIGDRVFFTGHITDPVVLDALYACANLFVFPSLYDTAGLVVREAAVMGTPSVVVRGSAPAEGIRDGINGYLCEDDDQNLAAVLLKALSDPSAREVGDAAANTLPLSWNGVINNVIARYQAIIERNVFFENGLA